MVAGDAHVSDYQFLLDHPATAEWVRRYATDERGWREAFGAALTTISVLGQESLIEVAGDASVLGWRRSCVEGEDCSRGLVRLRQ